MIFQKRTSLLILASIKNVCIQLHNHRYLVLEHFVWQLQFHPICSTMTKTFWLLDVGTLSTNHNTDVLIQAPKFSPLKTPKGGFPHGKVHAVLEKRGCVRACDRENAGRASWRGSMADGKRAGRWRCGSICWHVSSSWQWLREMGWESESEGEKGGEIRQA